MKTKLCSIYLAALAISGLLASCSSSHQVASNFYKRKYTKGYFFNRPGKYMMPDANKATAATSKTKPGITSTTAAPTQKTATANNQPAISHPAVSANAVQPSSDKKLHVQSVNNTIIPYSTPVSSNKTTNNTFSSNYRQNIQDAVSNTGGYHDYGKSSGPCKSWIAALLLCFFLGALGIHRFYLGYTWQGILQLVTLGGCGVWAFIDFVRILIRSLPPKDDDYCN